MFYPCAVQIPKNGKYVLFFLGVWRGEPRMLRAFKSFVFNPFVKTLNLEQRPAGFGQRHATVEAVTASPIGIPPTAWESE